MAIILSSSFSKHEQSHCHLCSKLRQLILVGTTFPESQPKSPPRYTLSISDQPTRARKHNKSRAGKGQLLPCGCGQPARLWWNTTKHGGSTPRIGETDEVEHLHSKIFLQKDSMVKTVLSKNQANNHFHLLRHHWESRPFRLLSFP